MSHTPGPWEADDPGETGLGMVEGVMIYANDAEPGGRLIAEVFDAANVPVIRAAPELLEALEEVVEAESEGLFPLRNMRLDEAFAAARAAIAKAKGGSDG